MAAVEGDVQAREIDALGCDGIHCMADIGFRRVFQLYRDAHARADGQRTAVEGIEAGKVIELGKDVAMQIAAMNPAFLDKSDVSQETLDKEKEIQLAMMANDPKMAAKPEKVKEGIVMGKLGKYYEENCLLQQAFVKENKISVEKHVAAVAKELGGQITVKAFTRFATGEGIEKKEDDFAAEVASMIH